MIKKQELGYNGMSKDLARDKQSNKYFDAKNIRILATDQQSSFAVTNEAGNELIVSIPSPVVNTDSTSIDYTGVDGSTKSLIYSTQSSIIPRCELEKTYLRKFSDEQIIIGTKELRDSALIVTTDNNGFDCFWELENLNDGNFELSLLYMGDLGLSKNNLVQVLFNYENSVIQKIYFVDGAHQLRFFNIKQSVENGDSINLIDLSNSAIDVVSTFNLSQPSIDGVVSGGSHTSGMIQYAYGLYILNGAQTTISPVSELVPIDKGEDLGGGEVNEILGKSVRISIANIDTKFTNVKIYSIKYTSYNQIPEINIVADREIDDFNSFTFTDDGTSEEAISLEAFTFLGSNPIIPKHIATKDNRLFPINIKELSFDVDLDCRAYSYNSSGNAAVLNNAFLTNTGAVSGALTLVPSSFNIPENNDSINADYNTQKYQINGSTYGATGKHIVVEVTQNSLPDSVSKNLQFLKDRELYRIGIKFYNRRGQSSEPNWIMDLKAPEGNLEGNYNQLRVSLTPNFYIWLNDDSNFDSEDDRPVGFKVLRADRTLSDQTIYSQGMINPMVANYLNRGKKTSLSGRKKAVNSVDSDIIPSVTRMFKRLSPFVECKDYHELCWESGQDNSFNDLGRGASFESYKASSSDDWRAQNFQHNRLMQFFSPEVLFRDNPIDSSYKLRVVGLAEQEEVNNWSTETNPNSGNSSQEIKFIGGIAIYTGGVNPNVISGSPNNVSDFGFFGPTNSDNSQATHQMYRSFKNFYKNSIIEYEIYGSPELTQEGADFTAYNNDFSLRYSNNLKTMIIDDFRNSDHVNDDCEVQVRGCNTIGAKCITFAEGPDESSYPLDARRSIEQMYTSTGISNPNGVLIAEFVKDSSVLYVGNIYGGMSNESKSVSSYIEIGEYTDLDSSTSVNIASPGDTFVNDFIFTKMAKSDTEVRSQAFNVVSEIVSIRVETTIDLKNRNDLSLGKWDNRWQPKYDEYQKYNGVYSQQPTLIKSVDTGNKIKKIQEFDGRIMSSKEKIPGEFIDSWTDFLENETMDLDGKYGPINAVVNLKDEIFCLQDTAVAHIAINPRVQVPGGDGIALELGTGGILHDYSYKSTTLGTLNKWGVINTENSFYFVDPINKGIMTFNGGAVSRLSDLKGFHHDLLNRISDEVRIDNPVLGTGVSVGYNPVNADVYFSFLQSTGQFTLGFNEKIGEFTSEYSYVPSWYINKGNVLISTNPASNQMWEHFKGLPNHFYGTHYKSSITLHIAPEGNEIILNNASYKLELTDVSGNEIPNKGLTGVRVYNDYQDSGEVELVLRQNVFHKFRNWKINMPRAKGSRDRVRSAWGFAEFSFNNEDGNKLILHDISIFYTQH